MVFREESSKLFTRTDFNQGWTEGKGELKGPDKWWIAYQAKTPQKQFIPERWQSAYHIIVVNRYLACVFGLGALILVFLTGRLIGGFWLGFLAMILLAQHPLFFRLSRQALADSILLFFTWGSLYWSLSFVRKKKLLGFGVWYGLTASVKLNGFMVLALGIITISVKEIRKVLARKDNYLKTVWQALTKMAIVSLLTVGIFVFLNPFLWPKPLKNFKFIFAARQEVAQKMQSSYSQNAYYSFAERLGAITEETILAGKINQRMLPWLPGEMDLALVIIGGAFIFFEIVIKRTNFIMAVFVLWALGTVFFMGSYLTVGFDRYFLPIIPFLVMVEAFGIYKLVTIITNTIKLITE